MRQTFLRSHKTLILAISGRLLLDCSFVKLLSQLVGIKVGHVNAIAFGVLTPRKVRRAMSNNVDCFTSGPGFRAVHVALWQATVVLWRTVDRHENPPYVHILCQALSEWAGVVQVNDKTL